MICVLIRGDGRVRILTAFHEKSLPNFGVSHLHCGAHVPGHTLLRGSVSVLNLEKSSLMTLLYGSDKIILHE